MQLGLTLAIAIWMVVTMALAYSLQSSMKHLHKKADLILNHLGISIPKEED
jgi:hypothetical protein